MADIERKLLKILHKVVKIDKQKGLTISLKSYRLEMTKSRKYWKLKVHWNSKKCLPKAKQCIRKILLETNKRLLNYNAILILRVGGGWTIFTHMERKLRSAEIFYRRVLIIPWKEVLRKMKAKRRVVLKIRRWLNFWDNKESALKIWYSHDNEGWGKWWETYLIICVNGCQHCLELQRIGNCEKHPERIQLIKEYWLLIWLVV